MGQIRILHSSSRKFSSLTRLLSNLRRPAVRFISVLCCALIVGCSKNPSFSLLSASQTFQQQTASVNNKIDILWVVDNSGSMDPLQANLVQNFNAFISRFSTLGFDYKMAVTTTDAYLADSKFNNNPSLAMFRDGVGNVLSGYYYITPTIPNIVPNFVTNATQGSRGSGDERAFSSLFTSLHSPLNAGFHREGAFFAVIILSDEDDFTDPTRPEGSWTNGGIADHDYTNPNLVSVNSVVAGLDAFTGSVPTNRHYNVSAITVLDQTCQRTHVQQSSSAIIGQRYIDLVNATGGVLGSVCDSNYANSLNFIQQRIVELTTEFPLTRTPNPSTITVSVNGAPVLEDSINGWSYDIVNNAIMFHGASVPASGAAINVHFDPNSLQ